jgi:hypothetical protein
MQETDPLSNAEGRVRVSESSSIMPFAVVNDSFYNLFTSIKFKKARRK